MFIPTSVEVYKHMSKKLGITCAEYICHMLVYRCIDWFALYKHMSEKLGITCVEYICHV